MIGSLPKSISVNGIDRPIDTNYRTILKIFVALNDAELTDQEKTVVLGACLYGDDFYSLPQDDLKEAIDKATIFLSGGAEEKSKPNNKKLMDWEQDEQMIFSAVNKVAGYETRNQEYMHWWTFLGFFNEIGEGLFSTVLGIRQKKAKGKKLEKHEQEFLSEHKELVNFKTKYTEDEQAEIDKFNKLLG